MGNFEQRGQIRNLLYRARNTPPTNAGYDEARYLTIEAALLFRGYDVKTFNMSLLDDLQLQSLHPGEINRLYINVMHRLDNMKQKGK
jgi:hypothetical protein